MNADLGLKPDTFLRQCPSRALLMRIGEKWTLMAVVALEHGPIRFGALRRRLEGISQKMLSQTLRNLERDGLVERRVYDGRPLKVEYELTARGRSFLPLAQALKTWAEDNLHDIEAGNAEHDRRPDAAMKADTTQTVAKMSLDGRRAEE